MGELEKLPPVIRETASAVDKATEALPSPVPFLHPASGTLLLVIDNALFGVNAVSLGTSTPITALIGFGSTFVGVFLVQKFLQEDSFGKSLTKAFIAGVLAGIPTSLAGTIAGGASLLSSGWHLLKRSGKQDKG